MVLRSRKKLIWLICLSTPPRYRPRKCGECCERWQVKKTATILKSLSRKLAMLAGVPFALARNMPGAGPADFLILSELTPPPWRLVTLRSWVQPPSVHRVKNSGIYSVFCIRGLWNPGKMHILEVFRLPFHLGCLDHLQIQHEEKGFMVSASSNMAVLASIWGAFFFSLRLSYLSMPCPC